MKSELTILGKNKANIKDKESSIKSNDTFIKRVDEEENS